MRVLALVLLVFGLLITAGASAQPPDEGPYMQAIREAVAAMDQERFEEAHTHFLRAHELQPSARTWRGLGIARYRMQAFAGAIRALRAALDSQVNPLTPEMRTEAEGLVEQAMEHVGTARVRLTPSSAELWVDGEPVRVPADGVLVLDPGRHRLVARAPEHREAARELQVSAGTRDTIHLTLAALSEPEPGPEPGPSPGPEVEPPPPGPAPGEQPPPPRTPSGGAGAARGVGIGLLVASGVTLGATLGSVVWVIGRNDQIDECRHVEASVSSGCVNQQGLDSQRDAAVVTLVSLSVLTAAAATTGIVLLALGSGDETDSERAVSCAPLGAGLLCSARF